MYRPRYSNKAHWHNLYSTKQWESIRGARLRVNPLCAFCLESGRATPASVVDHIEPHKGNKALFFDYANTQSLCKQCHDSAKQRYEKTGKMIGCNESGHPIDKRHHWN